MVSIIHKPSSTPSGNNKGSSGGLFDYLSKEDDSKKYHDKTHFFNDDKDSISKQEATNEIDSNKGKLGKNEYKFYMITINPSEKELHHLMPIGKNEVSELDKKELKEYEKKLMDYSRKIMDNYAASFNKGLQGKDMKYYGKIEHNRTYKHDEEKVKKGEVKTGDLKQGRHSHIHIVVSRYNKETTKKLSPLSQNRATSKNTNLGKSKVSQGFNHVDFKVANEKSFDKQFSYKREEKEKAEFAIDQKKKETKTVSSSNNENQLNSLEQKELQVFGDSKQVYYDAKQVTQNPLSPTQKSGINQKMREQDTKQIFAKEFKKMNPIKQFFQDETLKLKKAINYASN